MFENRIANEIIRESLVSVSLIFEWKKKEIESGNNSSLILVGGWAVDAFNPWYGSRDIDLMGNTKTQKRLSNFLYKELGFKKQRNSLGITKLYREVSGEEIITEFVSKNQFYRNTSYSVNYNLSTLNSSKARIRDGTIVDVPNRSTLLLMKIKAAWDRYNMLQERDPKVVGQLGYIRAKFIKDCGDIIALLDMRYSDTMPIDLKIVSDELKRRPFLTEFLLDSARFDLRPVEYRDLSVKDMKTSVQKLIEMVRV